MVIDKVKLMNSFLIGATTALGTAIVQETYRTYTAIDPMWEVRFKLGRRKRKKQFDHLMEQTNLKGELA